ncbi:MAG TPA: porin [Burkholderiales bacterium]|nr:porin [Burkholderiales bacterium]
MKLNRIAVAVALAMAGGSALGQQAAAPVTAESSVQIYGHLDLSIDTLTKGISGKTSGGNTATGKLGYQDDISSNLSYVGIRGGTEVAPGLRAVFQFETQIDVSATPGGSLSSSSQDNQVKGALASRNSFLGLAGGWGAFKLGKTDAPYKLSTARMDPFSATIGDYNSIMGNTGGDNRAEFDTRISHAAWYESPNMGGFRVNALYAPGQNRSSDNSTVASGEPSCTGGNTPAPNDPTGVCTDGSFGNAYSIAAIYEAGPLYLIAAYEKHKQVNRTGDELPPFPAAGAVGVVDENAFKAGVQYTLPTRTTLNFIVERMTRNAPDPNANERQRSGFWLAATQKVTANDDVNIGWAHAGKTPGDPGVGPVDNKANMLALGYKHHFNRQANWYAVYARQDNKDGAHYDLGASGHGITTDCHDAAGHCFPGGKIQGLSVGMQYNF